MSEHISPVESQRAQRIVFFDALRGFTIISMVLFHTCYDLAYLYAIPLPWFVGTIFQTVWRASISWTFLVLAGWMTSLSRNNIRRGLLYGAAALLVFSATVAASVDTAVSFGILYCMSACTLLWCAAQRALARIDARLFDRPIPSSIYSYLYASPRTLRRRRPCLAGVSFSILFFRRLLPIAPLLFSLSCRCDCSTLASRTSRRLSKLDVRQRNPATCLYRTS